MKLQDAYISETGTTIGNFAAIGYAMNGETPSFKYEEGGAVTYVANTATLGNGQKLWKATAKVALNDCKASSEWGLFGTRNEKGNGIDWTVGIGDGAASASGVLTDACNILTPQFQNLKTVASN